MRHISLFNGIGGFQLAAQWMGWENVASCEIDEWCNKVTKYHFPNCKQYGDIKTTDFSIYRGFTDIITGGDPCQPHSRAGLGKGKADDRYLWPEFNRAVREAKPAWVVNENVSGSVTNGIIDIKIDDLEAQGYTCQAYYIPAEAVGALHQRERIWIVAYNPDCNAGSRMPGEIQGASNQEWIQERDNLQFIGEPVDLRPNYSNTNSKRFQEQHISTEPEIQPEGLSRYFGFGPDAHGNYIGDEIKSAIIRMLNGLPEGLDYTDRNKRIKGLGNAIVPQVAYEIFKAIEQFKPA